MEVGSNAFVAVLNEHDKEIDRIPASHVQLNYPDMPWRADPTIGQSSGGILFAAMFKRLFTSEDSGYSWMSMPINIACLESCKGFGIRSDDTLLLLYSASASEPRKNYISVARSIDFGETWEAGEPIDISPFTGIPGADGNNICTLPDGTDIVAISHRYGDGIRDNQGVELPLDEKGGIDFVYRSTDGGRTWGGRTAIAKYTGESRFLSLGEDRVLAAIRRQRWFLSSQDPPELWEQTGGGQDIINKQLYLANSYDGGRTWKDMRQLTTANGDCPGELVRLSDNRIVVLYYNRYPYVPGYTIARVSGDGGVTWSVERYVVSTGSGYSSSTVLEDDSIVTVCGNTLLDHQGVNTEPWKANSVKWSLPE